MSKKTKKVDLTPAQKSQFDKDIAELEELAFITIAILYGRKSKIYRELVARSKQPFDPNSKEVKELEAYVKKHSRTS